MHPFYFHEIIQFILVCVICFIGNHTNYSSGNILQQPIPTKRNRGNMYCSFLLVICIFKRKMAANEEPSLHVTHYCALQYYWAFMYRRNCSYPWRFIRLSLQVSFLQELFPFLCGSKGWHVHGTQVLIQLACTSLCNLLNNSHFVFFPSNVVITGQRYNSCSHQNTVSRNRVCELSNNPTESFMAMSRTHSTVLAYPEIVLGKAKSVSM